MKLNSFSLFGIAIAFSLGTAGLHLSSVKPIAISGSTPAAIAIPIQTAATGAILNLKTMQITQEPISSFVEKMPGGGIVNLPANVPPAVGTSAVPPGPLTGTETLK